MHGWLAWLVEQAFEPPVLHPKKLGLMDCAKTATT
jgi:hypothetical protein